jgi:hypothetical protein
MMLVAVAAVALALIGIAFIVTSFYMICDVHIRAGMTHRAEFRR